MALSIAQYLQPGAQPMATPFQGAANPNQVVQGSLDYFMNPNSEFMQQAAQRGLNTAAQRGGINSSIAAGASQRAAQEAAIPLAQQAVNIQQQREQVEGQDWLSKQNFSRALQGQLTMVPLTNSMNMLNVVQQYALEDPELYTPEVTSGYSNFFQKNMDNLLANYFKNLGF